MAAVSEDLQVQSFDAPAKINLFLHVVGRRDDGYHLLESLVAFASIGDRITVSPSGTAGVNLTVAGRFAGLIDGPAGENLVLRAAEALRARGGDRLGASIRLDKNLPVAAGIGGGSADAAATLLALNRFWNLGLSQEELAAIGLGLGADVPACLQRSAILMRGIGEQISPAAVPAGLGVILINPMKPLPTPAVFADFRNGEPFADLGRQDWTAAGNRELWLDRLRATGNSLEPPARRLLPAIGKIVETLQDVEGCRIARMSGSGATCFGLFDDWQTAARRADNIASAHPDWWVAPGRLLT
ncbi:MAG: 4-(cytidine 5'-diphospho)-2-C-methyl-D-erythritol kinase [Minwuia sp.]|uniref:4-(cytidine 5'-diphospho)-2-C-methyl-D-erythritol kinase n=1 Tax=Minwuia sp. TaxID=2493630 RepID=UPI003A848A41